MNIDSAIIRAARDLESRGVPANTSDLRRALAEQGISICHTSLRRARSRLVAAGSLCLALRLQPQKSEGAAYGLDEADHLKILQNAAVVRLESLGRDGKFCNKPCNFHKTLYHALCSPRFDAMTGREMSDYLRPHMNLFTGV